MENEKVEATNITYIKKIGKNEKLKECINLIRVLVRRYLGNNRNWLEEEWYRQVEIIRLIIEMILLYIVVPRLFHKDDTVEASQE